MSAPVVLVVHGHFYQPPRENPWTEEVPREPSAAPFHDWNERIAAESYRPNAAARILDDRGRVLAIVNNYEHLSFDFGPTLTSWLEEHDPDTLDRVLAADRSSGGAIAQPYFHVILPLATERDARTQVRWGLAEFAQRFGRAAEGIWLPETAVNDAVLRVLAQEGVRFTVLAPDQAASPIDTRRPYRWVDPADPARSIDLIFYDGGLSHAIAFELPGLTSQALVDRVQSAAGDGGLVTLAADGETFGHHHHWGDRLLAYALATEAPKRGIEVTNVAGYLRANPPEHEASVIESAWSCAHGVGRWKEDCGCSTGGGPDWHQRWRAPLREALDIVRDAVDATFDRRGPGVLHDPWSARDEYVHVLLGAMTMDEFAERYVSGDRVEAFTLLEAARHSLAMYTSCGWFFNDVSGLETVQVLRYAARALDCLSEIGEEPPLGRVLAVLEGAESNVASERNGRVVWERHVETARVGPDRVAAHLALVSLLERTPPPERVATYDVATRDHEWRDRGPLALTWGRVGLVHRRTGRSTEHLFAAINFGGLEVFGATREVAADGDEGVFVELLAAFDAHASVATLLRLLSDGFGPREFGLSWALPDAAEQFLQGAASALVDRFAGAYERLFADHRPTLTALAAAGYPLPPELRAPGELSLARQFEAHVASAAGSLDRRAYAGAMAIAEEARQSGVTLHVPAAVAAVESLLLASVEGAVDDPSRTPDVLAVLGLADDLGLRPSIARAQELVYDALLAGDRDALAPLADALDLAV